MNEEERLKEIKIKLEKSNKYMMFVEYDDIRFLINTIDTMNKRARMNKAIKYISNYWQDEKEIDNNKLKDDTSYRTLADKTIILIEKSLKGE